MHKKFTRKVLLILVVLSSLFLVYRFNFGVVKADSGFDSSYDSGGWDSGGSDWGGSDWGGSSSWSWGDHDYDSSTYYGNSSVDFKDFFIVCIMVISFVILTKIIFVIVQKLCRKLRLLIVSRISILLEHSKEISDNEVKAIIPNFDKKLFLNERYQNYLDVQDAWMNFDYDKLRSLLTDELYNQYKMQLETMKLKREVNIMKDFKYNDSMITNITCENNQIAVTIELICSFKDYIEYNKKVLRGSNTRSILQHYEMIFVCNLEDKLDKCPNCGSEVNQDASQTCKYCNSVIAKVSDKWVLSKKESKEQGWK